jgi:hypothetical protein
VVISWDGDTADININEMSLTLMSKQQITSKYTLKYKQLQYESIVTTIFIQWKNELIENGTNSRKSFSHTCCHNILKNGLLFNH